MKLRLLREINGDKEMEQAVILTLTTKHKPNKVASLLGVSQSYVNQVLHAIQG